MTMTRCALPSYPKDTFLVTREPAHEDRTGQSPLIPFPICSVDSAHHSSLPSKQSLVSPSSRTRFPPSPVPSSPQIIMPPIPIHASSPINQNQTHPTASLSRSPSSAAARYTPQAPAAVDAGPTTTTTVEPGPGASAQPGAPAYPQPTNAVSSSHNQRITPAATPTSNPPAEPSSITFDPAPPQPGAVPAPQPPRSPKLAIPPHPQPNALPSTSVSPTIGIRHSLPSPTPTRNRPTPSTLYPPVPATTPAPTADLSHPPGYQQDHRASFEDKPVEFCQPIDRRASPSSRRGGILDGAPTMERDDDENTVFNQAMGWAKAAGKRLSRTEEQIWRNINGDGKS